ncbi:YggS family pyridoxal phosphate-dependent enzyme [Hylemonella gracilis]|uniref:YggS family pyridoxal phosphate-dependent enzyme n=1 Tax=Hylemonella gracilis TaxID=80880 RepID=UPI000687FBBB|nr:YggS family pyridoxal phosphate-dependent enzyme [Hylemonella gracilis]
MPDSPLNNPAFSAALRAVQTRIAAACAAAGRDPASVQLLAVSKTFGPEAVRVAYQAGLLAFGENYIQEAVAKMVALADLPLQWHCIGPIQSNKTRLVAEHFAWAQTVDRLKIAQRLAEQRPAHLPPLQVCLQVNVDGGPTKAGVAPEDLPALARAVRALPRLRLRGLMCIPDPQPDAAAMQAVFARALVLFDALRADWEGPDPEPDTLSMGMSADLEAAIAAGSTLVRIGSALFGARPVKPAAAAPLAGAQDG